MIYNSLPESSATEPSATPVATLAVAPAKRHDAKTTLYFQVILAAVFIVALILLGWSSASGSKATLTLDLTNAHRTFQGKVVSGMTVFDAFKLALDAAALDLQVKNDPDAPRMFILDAKNPTVLEEVAKVLVNGRQITPAQMSSVTLNPDDQVLVIAQSIME